MLLTLTTRAPAAFGTLALSLVSPLSCATEALPEVVVTAQRTSALESKTPVSMTVLSGEQLVDAGLDNPGDLGARIPNVEFNNGAEGLRMTMRGVSNADSTGKGDPSAAFMLDGVYIARPQIQNLSFYDLERVEVLRGPQGTLYGRNTNAGAVNVISKQPEDSFAAAAHAGIGSYRQRQGGAMLNLPLNDALALRAALNYQRHDSYLRNDQGTPYQLGLDRDTLSARLSARLKLNADATLLIRTDHSRVDDSNDSYVPDTNFYTYTNGQPVWRGGSARALLTNGFRPRNTTPSQGHSRKSTTGVSAELTWNLGPATLHYLAAHRDYQHQQLTNYYYGLGPRLALGVHQDFDGYYRDDTHELRLSTPAAATVSGQAGLYYFRERSSQAYTFRDLVPAGLPPYYKFPHGATRSASRAVFGQATWRVQPNLRLSAGARYTEDDKSRVGATSFQQRPEFNPQTDFQLLNAAALSTGQTTWRLGVDFDLAPATLLYAAIATGYKAGGFNDGCTAGSSAMGLSCRAAQAVPAATLLYQPETVRSYEAGVKTRFWERRAILNLSVFSYDYNNLQLSGLAIVQGAPRFVTANAGLASVKGLEAEGLLQLTTNDRLTYALALLDAHYVHYLPNGVNSWAGKKLDRAPPHSISFGYEHSMHAADGVVTAGLHTRRSADYVIGVPSLLLQYRIPGRTESSASLRYTPQHGAWTALARVNNIENRIRPINIDSFGMITPSDPRTAELRVDVRF